MKQEHKILATTTLARAFWQALVLRTALLFVVAVGMAPTSASACAQRTTTFDLAQKLRTAAIDHSVAFFSFVMGHCLTQGQQPIHLAADSEFGKRASKPTTKSQWRKVYRRCQLRSNLRSRLDYLKLLASLLVMAMFSATFFGLVVC
jgi:hypothetical protein